MERLTKIATKHTGNMYVSAIGTGKGAVPRIIQRLAAYENTGLEPEEIDDGIRSEQGSLEETIRLEVECLGMQIRALERRLDREVQAFKAYIAEGDTRRVVEAFEDSKFKFIQSDYNRLYDLREKRDLLQDMITK